MSIALVVTQPFRKYEKGALITDPDTVAMLLAKHPQRVVKVAAPAAPAAAPAEPTPATPPAPAAQEK